MARASSLEALRKSFEKNHHPSAAYRARELARRLGIAVPPWATLRKPGRDGLSLDELRERHDRGALPPDRLSRLRMLARRRAEAAGVAVPDWATKGRRGRRTIDRAMPGAPSVAPRTVVTAARSIATARAVWPASASWGFGLRPKKGPPLNTPNAAPHQIPAVLRAWREARRCRVVQITGERVTLHELGGPARSFACAADAVAAVASLPMT